MEGGHNTLAVLCVGNIRVTMEPAFARYEAQVPLGRERGKDEKLGKL